MKRLKYLQLLDECFGIEKLILLLGARQVGKTTIMHQFQEQIQDTHKTLYINIEDYPEVWNMSSLQFISWTLVQFGFDCTKLGVLFLDEVQVFKQTETFLKTIYDNQNIQCKIIATGSRFWGQKVVGSSLIGRGKQIRVYTFDIYEFLQAREKHIAADTPYARIQEQIQEYLQWGGYPAVVFAKTVQAKKEQLERIIVRLYEKDFQYSLKQENLPSFKSMFLWLAQNIGNIAKIEHIAAYSMTSAYKIKPMLQFLQDAYLIDSIYPYVIDKTKEIIQKPKYYFHDIGIISFLQGGFDMLREGKVVENFVYQQIISTHIVDEIKFYQTIQKSEIDFVTTIGKNRYWIEAKAGDSTTVPKIMYHIPYTDKDIFIKTTKSIADTVHKEVDVNLIPYWTTGGKLHEMSFNFTDEKDFSEIQSKKLAELPASKKLDDTVRGK